MTEIPGSGAARLAAAPLAELVQRYWRAALVERAEQSPTVADPERRPTTAAGPPASGSYPDGPCGYPPR